MTALKADSILVAAGRPKGRGEPLNTPLVPASNFILGDEPVYSREHGVPTWQALESVVGALEQGGAVAFASGMAAVSAVFEQLAPGARVALPDDCYQGVAALAAEGLEKQRWTIDRLATDDTAGWIEAAASHDLLWVETPSNPLLNLADLEAICAAPRKAGGLLVVDNTFATPLNQQPLRLGADLSLHSATKFMGGHSDLLAGIVVAREGELERALRTARQRNGATPGTLEAFLTTRGLRTLALRLERAERNALAIARFLEAHPQASAVRYPGLPSHPQHDLAARQLGGFGAIICFELADARIAEKLCRSVRLIRHATSLGSVETTIERRAMHPGQEHLPGGLLRISVGIEAADDLTADLAQALATP